MSDQLLTVIGGLIVALLGWQGKRYTDKLTTRTAEKAATGELELRWVQELRAEIADLRKQVDELRTHVETKDRIAWALGDYLDELSSFVHYGRKGLYPSPPEGEAATHYNRARWLAIKELHDKRVSAAQQPLSDPEQ